jgi:regulation of enolase protein 1 (concanavalin A-like superfamily)
MSVWKLVAQRTLIFWWPIWVAGAGLDPADLAPADVGSPSIAGTTLTENQTVTITASGKGIGFTSDQFHFAAAPEPGDFDVRVRVSALKNTDLWAKAGLMLRTELRPGVRFAGVFTTPSGAGCLFQARVSDSASASYQGSFPVNQPFTWLRLRRVGEIVSGYAGYDGRHWSLLGSRTIMLGTNALLGLAVTSHNTNATTAVFQDLGIVDNPVIASVSSPLEWLGPTSRRTALALSEIMYHPADRPDGKNLEYVELYNSQPYYEDISGWKLTGDIQFTFPTNTLIAGGGFLVVAAIPQDVQAVYALDPVLGPYAGKLNNAGGKLRLLGDQNAVLLDLEFKDQAPWPVLADGTGHSLVLVRPSFGEADPRAWAASRVKGGSPGLPEALEITGSTGVCINESQLADGAGGGFVELFNAAATEADLGGVRLGCAKDSLPFAVPVGTRLPPGGFLHFTWAQLGFSPKATGDTIYLESADHSRFLDAVTFGPQVPGTSSGRWPNGGSRIRVLPQPTPGAANVHPQSEVVINEIHYSPISGASDEEFIELYNTGSADVDLGDWQFTSGVSFTFPSQSTLPAGGYLVVAHNAARLKALYPSLEPGQVVGDFQGKLSGRGEHLVLSRPIWIQNDAGNSEAVLAAVTEAVYEGGGRWAPWSDAGGSTLELIDPRADTCLTSNWADSDESGRGEWTTVEYTGVLDNGSGTPDSLHLLLLGEGECLVDNVEVIGPGNNNRISNGTFEPGVTGWSFSGNHVRSSLETNAAYQGSRSLHLRASGNGDTGANKIYVRLSQALASGNTATLRARVKWLRGWPEILMRLHGNYLEAYGCLNYPANPGTPGARNSRADVYAGPGFGEVSHFPAVPAVNESVVVTARVDDPDGVDSVTLRYRVEPYNILTNVVMHDDGVAGDTVPGDGVYSGLIPAPGAARLAAFTIEARGNAANAGITWYPPGATNRECLVRFGDGFQSGAFGTYRLWVTQKNSSTWASRPELSNEPIDGTFVCGNSRIVYSAGARFAGSPFHQQFSDGPASQAHFVVELPKDDRVLGAVSFNKLHAPGNGPFDDTTLQREQIIYWLARKSGLPWLHRRYFHFYVNGAKKQNLMEDTQVGSDDLVQEFWPEDAEGKLYKLQPWFEFPDAVSQTLQMSSATMMTLSRFITTSNQLKQARYRWNWLVRGAEGTANDYTNVLQLINVATDTGNRAYETNVDNLVQVDKWLRSFAINHAAGNWDIVGYRNGQNAYAYKPRNGRWEFIIWDANISLGNPGSDGPSGLPLFTTQDATLSRWLTQGGFKRRYLTALYELVYGPLQTNRIAPILDAKYNAFLEHGVTATSPVTIKSWIASARANILSQINSQTAPFAITRLVTSNSITLAGIGPLDMISLQINGAPVPVTWISTKNWTASYLSSDPTNQLVVAALNSKGEPLANTQQSITLGHDKILVLLRDGNDLVLEYPVTRSGFYQLQAVSALSLTNWLVVTQQNVNVGTLRFRVTAPSEPMTFYQIREP